MKYKFFDHTADVLFEAYGKNLEELFENAALATESIMVETKSIKKKEQYDIFLQASDIENLLYDFLSELIFLKDTEGLLFSKFSIIITCSKGKYELNAKCEGDFIDRERHELIADAKAVTLHEFKVEQKEDRSWFSKVIIDI
ncbi:archease [Candidatus Woesearchaeota archaeon]|nr:archease [Candidatus Woesearchaeota archaeon]